VTSAQSHIVVICCIGIARCTTTAE